MLTSSQQGYLEREKRVTAAIAFEKHDRIPVLSFFGTFAFEFCGIKIEAEMYDMMKRFDAHFVAHMDLQPDMAALASYIAPLLETLDFRQLGWAGHNPPSDIPFQFVEGEPMKDYEAFLYDPSDFILRTFCSRVFGKLDALRYLPTIRSIISCDMGGEAGFLATAISVAGHAFEALRQAGEKSVDFIRARTDYVQKLKDSGFPLLFAGSGQAPFDALEDYFRGPTGIMRDICKKPQMVIKACEKLVPIVLENAADTAKRTGNPRIFIPLHEQSLLSLEQFERFYWPTLKDFLIGLIYKELTPILWLEGDFTSRLNALKDVPERKVCYWFDSVDLQEARKTLGGKVCMMGGVPLSLLRDGTTEEVRARCKKIIDSVGREGGFIMNSSEQLDYAKPENVRVMIEFTKQYGAY